VSYGWNGIKDPPQVTTDGFPSWPPANLPEPQNPPRGGTPPTVKPLLLSHVSQSHVSREARRSDPLTDTHLILFRAIDITHQAQWLIIGCATKCNIPSGDHFPESRGNLYRLWRHAQYL
jgi:hypothetical protein